MGRIPVVPESGGRTESALDGQVRDPAIVDASG